MRILLFLLLLIPFFAQAQIKVLVTAVHDGDSYFVRFPDGTREWIRLYGVDCPEVISNHITRNQPFGVQTANFVRGLLKGKEFIIDTLKRDPYDRLVCRVMLNDTTELSEYLVANGYAWSLVKQYDALQKAAKQTKINLWGLKGRQIKPATFRRKYWHN